MKKFIPKINIREDRLYLVLRNHPEGYSSAGELYSKTKDGAFICNEVTLDLNIYTYYCKESFNTFRTWSNEIYDKHNFTIQDWNSIYEFKSLRGVKRFLNTLKYVKDLQHD